MTIGWDTQNMIFIQYLKLLKCMPISQNLRKRASTLQWTLLDMTIVIQLGISRRICAYDITLDTSMIRQYDGMSVTWPDLTYRNLINWMTYLHTYHTSKSLCKCIYIYTYTFHINLHQLTYQFNRYFTYLSEAEALPRQMTTAMPPLRPWRCWQPPQHRPKRNDRPWPMRLLKSVVLMAVWWPKIRHFCGRCW